MYNKAEIDSLIMFVKKYNGIGDKDKLSDLVKEEYSLERKRAVFYGKDFSVCFCEVKSESFSGVVLSLRTLEKYDDKPFFVCVVYPNTNEIFICNATFINKISHSSQGLTMQKIRGSFLGSDIIKNFNGIDNIPENFNKLYSIHCERYFRDNLERLVENTNGIKGTKAKYIVDEENKVKICSSVNLAKKFVDSDEYKNLKEDFCHRTEKVKKEIVIASNIDSVNIRGRVIEFLITSDDIKKKNQIIKALNQDKPLPRFITKDDLGDYTKKYENYNVETDVKSKIMDLNGTPKAYNIDKLLEFLSKDKSVYMFCFIGIGDNGDVYIKFVSVFDVDIIDATIVEKHLAGRNTRGAVQLFGNKIKKIIGRKEESIIDEKKAEEFLEKIIAL